MKPEKIYEMWHQKEVKTAKTRRFTFPEEVFVLGKAETIDYDSDKWERDREFYPYGHNFDSHPTVYGAKGTGARKSVASLLGVRDPNNSEWEMPVLAYCTELCYDDGVGLRKLRFAGRVVLTCSNDRKTLVILSNSRPVFIRGGQMIATERGIVK